MINKEDILEQLENYNFARGKIVTVHTSLKSIGEIEGGADTLISALVDFFAVGDGLLCIPTHTWNSTVYDRNKSESCIGVLPRVALTRTDGVRTRHPSHSMVVFGEKTRVEEFVKYDDEVFSPTDPRGCYGRLYDEDGYVLLIGVGHDKNTFIHCVEEMLKVPGRLTENVVERTIIHRDGREEKRLMKWYDTRIIPDVSKYFVKFEPAFRYYGAVFDGNIGNAKVQLCSAKIMKEVVELIYKNSMGTELLNNSMPLCESLYINER